MAHEPEFSGKVQTVHLVRQLMSKPSNGSPEAAIKENDSQCLVSFQDSSPGQDFDSCFKPARRMIIERRQHQRDLRKTRAKGSNGLSADGIVAGFAFYGQKRPMPSHN